MLVLWIILIVLMALGIVISQDYNCAVGAALAGALISIFLGKAWLAIENLSDTTNWKSSQRKLKRGGFIKDDTIVRISFAYLYRIKIGNKYLLVPNSRNTGKFQPVGGVYKFFGDEKMKLKNLCHIMDDDKIPIDKSSKNDYRLRMENRYLRKFVRRFNSKKASRERIDNVSREFREELVEKGIVGWDKISYRYCGRFMSDLRFEEHFQIYEMQLFDVVELNPTLAQELDLEKLLSREDDAYRFATAEQIRSLGMDSSAGKLYEWIGDQTKKTLQEYETKLMRVHGTGKEYGPINLQ